MKHRYSYCLLGLIFILASASTSWAVPSLGVATDGIYYVSPGDEFEDYQDYFASGSAPASENGGNEGFMIGPSGADLTIFTNIVDADIYLLIDSDMYSDSFPIFFDGEEFEEILGTGQADGYKPLPYYMVRLGKIPVDGGDGWTELPSDPFEPEPFYSYTGQITYSGVIPGGSYFFAAADETGNGLNFNNPDPFSPKTTSTTAVPEPSTILLLSIGLVSITAYRLKRKKV